MHREIMNVSEQQEIDHINRNGFDNRQNNLRLCNRMQNMQNRHKKALCTSSYKGVYYEKNTMKWRVQIIVNKKRYRLGRYKNELQAARIYDQKARELCGEYACTNF